MNHRMHVREGDRRDVTGGHAVDALPVKQMKRRVFRRNVRRPGLEHDEMMENLSQKKRMPQRPPLANYVAAVKNRREQVANGGGRRRRNGESAGTTLAGKGGSA